MKTILVIVTIMSAIFSSGALALESKSPSPSPSVSVGSTVTNQYLASGTGSVLSKDPAVQSDLFVLFPNGMYVDLWNSRSLKGSWDDGSFGNEVDYSIGWKGVVPAGVRLHVGTSYYDEPHAFELGKGDILYTHLFLTKDTPFLSVTLGYENYVTMPNSGFRGGNLMSLGAAKDWSLYNNKLGVHVSVATVYDCGTLGTSQGVIVRGRIGADWKVGKQLTLNVMSAPWFVPVTTHDKRTTNAALSMGVTWNSK